MNWTSYLALGDIHGFSLKSQNKPDFHPHLILEETSLEKLYHLPSLVWMISGLSQSVQGDGVGAGVGRSRVEAGVWILCNILHFLLSAVILPERSNPLRFSGLVWRLPIFSEGNKKQRGSLGDREMEEHLTQRRRKGWDSWERGRWWGSLPGFWSPKRLQPL